MAGLIAALRLTAARLVAARPVVLRLVAVLLGAAVPVGVTVPSFAVVAPPDVIGLVVVRPGLVGAGRLLDGLRLDSTIRLVAVIRLGHLVGVTAMVRLSYLVGVTALVGLGHVIGLIAMVGTDGVRIGGVVGAGFVRRAVRVFVDRDMRSVVAGVDGHRALVV